MKLESLDSPPPDVQKKIFDPFFTTKDVNQGTGLGLSIVHGIIESHGGAISVKSTLGEGSRFDVYLPHVAGTATPPSATNAPAVNVVGVSQRVLLVDDEAPLLEMAQECLERSGYQVDALTSSVQAVDVFRADPQKYAVVVTDHMMPGMTGIELATQLLGIRPDIPIILATGYSETVTPQKARAVGIREYMVKPYDPVELANAVHQAVGAEVVEV